MMPFFILSENNMETALLQALLQEIADDVREIKTELNTKQGNPPELLDEGGAADFLGMRPQTLGMWRHKGVGPKYVKVGNAVRYRISDLDAYLEQQTVA